MECDYEHTNFENTHNYEYNHTCTWIAKSIQNPTTILSALNIEHNYKRIYSISSACTSLQEHEFWLRAGAHATTNTYTRLQMWLQVCALTSMCTKTFIRSSYQHHYNCLPMSLLVLGTTSSTIYAYRFDTSYSLHAHTIYYAYAYLTKHSRELKAANLKSKPIVYISRFCTLPYKKQIIHI